MSSGNSDQRMGSALWNPWGWWNMARDLWRMRELVLRLAHRDIAVRYRHAFLGYLWALILPLMTVGVFTYLANKQVLSVGETSLPYPVFALWGIILWQLFSNILSSCTNSLANAGSLVTRINFPKEALVFSAVGQPLVDFSIKLIPLVLLFWYYGIAPGLTALFIPLLLIPLVLLAVGLGCLLSLANLLARDVANLVGVFATFGMFAAPILYPPPSSAPFDLVNVLNPFSPLLIATQDLLAHGELRHAGLLAGGLVFAGVMFLLGWRIFRIVIVRVAERA